jgi:hypothetical protein
MLYGGRRFAFSLEIVIAECSSVYDSRSVLSSSVSSG